MASFFSAGSFVQAVTIYQPLGQSAGRTRARFSRRELTRCLINVTGYFYITFTRVVWLDPLIRFHRTPPCI